MIQINSYIRLLRINQWLKNLLVFVGIIYSKDPITAEIWLNLGIVTLAFCCISSSVYIINDIHDRSSDSYHPIKAQRPIASGQISTRHALIMCGLLMLSSLFLAYSVSTAAVLFVVCYFVINFIYTIFLKKIAIVDIACIAAGFILRILAGTIGVGITPSLWLLLCAAMLTLLVGFSKRRAEINVVKDNLQYTRPGLQQLPRKLYDYLIIIFAILSGATYTIYTVYTGYFSGDSDKNLLLTLPFSIFGIIRYLQLIYKTQDNDDPLVIALRDKIFVFNFICWLSLTIYLQS